MRWFRVQETVDETPILINAMETRLRRQTCRDQVLQSKVHKTTYDTKLEDPTHGFSV